MLPPRSLIAAALVIYSFIDHHCCQSTGKVSNLITRHDGNGVRTENGVENRPSLGTTSSQSSRQTTTDGSMQYLHYAARSDDDNQYRDHDYDSDRFVVQAQRRVEKPPGGGVTGPVHTYIKTDKNANFKWGVRHFAGKRYGRRRR